MDAITSYIDHMFRSLPQTGEVRRARGELKQMTEDRYHELLAEGVSENEAVGRVITQFGNLDELADDLGIRSVMDGHETAAVELSAAEAERYVRTSRRASLLIGSGVFTILVGVATQIFFDQAEEANSDLSNALGLGLFFFLIAAAVAQFIIGGMMLGRFARLEDRVLHLDGVALSHYQQLREREEPRFIGLVVAGVVTIILGAASFAVGFSMEDSGVDALNLLKYAGPVLIGAGVFLLVVAGMRRGALDRLTQNDDVASEPGNPLVERWAGPYFLLAIVIYVSWSFISGDWSRSWIVFPIAAVGFALLAGILNAARPADATKR